MPLAQLHRQFGNFFNLRSLRSLFFAGHTSKTKHLEKRFLQGSFQTR
jgi:hypothetical protein